MEHVELEELTEEHRKEARVILDFLIAKYSEKSISVEDILSPKRGTYAVSDFRFLYLCVLKDTFTKLSLNNIGALVGGRHHSTVINAREQLHLAINTEDYEALLAEVAKLDFKKKTESVSVKALALETEEETHIPHAVRRSMFISKRKFSKKSDEVRNEQVEKFKFAAEAMQSSGSEFFGTSSLFTDGLASGFKTFLESKGNSNRQIKDVLFDYLQKRIHLLPREEFDLFFTTFQTMAVPK